MSVRSNGVSSVDLEELVTETQTLNFDTCPKFSNLFDGFPYSKRRSYHPLGLDLIEVPVKQLKISDYSDLTMEGVGHGEC